MAGLAKKMGESSADFISPVQDRHAPANFQLRKKIIQSTRQVFHKNDNLAAMIETYVVGECFVPRQTCIKCIALGFGQRKGFVRIKVFRKD